MKDPIIQTIETQRRILTNGEPGKGGKMTATKWKSRGLSAILLALCFSVALFLMVASSVTTKSKALLLEQPSKHQETQHRRLTTSTEKKHSKPRRILYIVTTLAEYNSGTRSTIRGSDRLQETLIPVVTESIRSMLDNIDNNYQVDLYLICHFTLTTDREELIRQALPESVGLNVWNDATPLGYDTGKEHPSKAEYRTLHLARQHRFVIKDKLMDYDLFVCFEDDMLIKGEHVQHFEAVTEELERLYEEAPDKPPIKLAKNNVGAAKNNFHGGMTKGQLKRMLPGFIRVEVLLDEEKYGAQKETGPVPIDLHFDDSGTTQEVDSEICCHVSENAASKNRPPKPASDKVFLWETNILPLGVRKMPKDSFLDWVVLQRGPNQNNLNSSDVIGDYWSNRNRDYWDKGTRRPAPMEFKYINNQGGWMATRRQLWRWHTEICPGGFLPPYDSPHYRFDGLDMRNVEWYSGGMQLSTVRHACNMQRIIMLDPDGFSKSLIYHSANNKQRQLAGEGKSASFSKANTLLGQLNTVKKRAEQDMKDAAEI